MRVLFTNELLNFDSLILKNNHFDLIVTIYWINSNVDSSEHVKNEIKSCYRRNANFLKDYWTEHILFFNNIKKDKSSLIVSIQRFIENKIWLKQEEISYFNYWIHWIDKIIENKVQFNIEWWRFVWSKIIQNLYSSKWTKRRKKESKINLVDRSNFEENLFDWLISEIWTISQWFDSLQISQISSIYSHSWFSESQFIKLLSHSLEEYDFEKDLLEAFIQDFDIKRNWLQDYDFDNLFINFLDEETKNCIEMYFDSCFVKQKYQDNFFEKNLQRVKDTWYIHYWLIWNLVDNFIKRNKNLRDSYNDIKNFFDEFVVWWFQWLNASFVLLYFKFSDNKIFKFEEIWKISIWKSYVDFYNKNE